MRRILVDTSSLIALANAMRHDRKPNPDTAAFYAQYSDVDDGIEALVLYIKTLR